MRATIGQRVGTGLLHQEPEVAGAKPGLPPQQAPEGERDLAEELQHREHVVPCRDGGDADAGEGRARRLHVARVLLPRDARRERQHAAEAVGKGRLVERDLALLGEVADPDDEAHEAAVPGPEISQVEREAGGLRRCRERTLDVRERRDPGVERPRAGESHDQGAVARPAHRDFAAFARRLPHRVVRVR